MGSDELAATRDFRSDLAAAVRGWRVGPAFPVVSAVLAAAIALPEGLWPLSVLAVLISIGWVGTQRVWYLRVFRGEQMGLRDARVLTRLFFARYLRFAFAYASLGAGLPMTVALVRSGGDVDRIPEVMDVLHWILLATFLVASDVICTFVTPSLAFSTARVRDAFRIGVRMLRSTWPGCAPYALIPPLAFVVVSGLSLAGQQGPLWLTTSLAVLATLLNLAFKGAVVIFFLDHHPRVDRDGAAFLRARTPRLPRPRLDNHPKRGPEMGMADIKGRERLERIFGAWPSFQMTR